MNNELLVLNNIDKNGKATQRELAQITGMSLGNINLLIKRLVKKGLLEIERLNPRTVRYMLTPRGIKENSESTYRHIVKSYGLVNSLNQKIESFLLENSVTEKSGILLFGIEDEVFELISSKLDLIKTTYIFCRSLEEVKKALKKDSKDAYVVIAWYPQYMEMLMQENMEFTNILEKF